MPFVPRHCCAACAGAMLIAGCQSPYDPRAGEEQVRVEVAGTVLWADGSSVVGAMLVAEYFTCYDSWGNYTCTWTTGGRTVLLDSDSTDADGRYLLGWAKRCTPGSWADASVILTVPGVPRERMWLFDVRRYQQGMLECRTGTRKIDFVIERRVPILGACAEGYVVVDASGAYWADRNKDEVVCRSGDAYRDNDQ